MCRVNQVISNLLLIEEITTDPCYNHPLSSLIVNTVVQLTAENNSEKNQAHICTDCQSLSGKKRKHIIVTQQDNYDSGGET